MDINQNYQSLLLNVTFINKLFIKGNKYLPQIQKISSAPNFIILTVRFFKKTWNLYLGRGGTGTGLFAATYNLPAELRIKDKFLDINRAFLNNTYIKNIEIDNNDKIINIRVVQFSEAKEQEIDFLYFWRGRELLFVIVQNDKEKKVLKSWIGKWQQVESLPECIFSLFNEVGRRKEIQNDVSVHTDDFDVEERNNEKLKTNLEEVVKGLLKEQFKKKSNKISKKIENIKNDLAKLNDWKEFYDYFKKNEEEVIVSSEYKFKSLKLKNIKGKTFHEKRGLIYEKCKTNIKNIDFVEKRLLNETKTLEVLKNSNEKEKISMDLLKRKIMMPLWLDQTDNSQKSTTNVKKEENYIILKYEFGEFAVGLNALGNDEMRKNWADKEDWWFHSENGQSCHVIYRPTNLSSLTEKLFQLIGTILIDYSKLKTNEINMVYTKVKYLKSLKGRPGSVIYKHEKHIRTYYLDNWREIISVS